MTALRDGTIRRLPAVLAAISSIGLAASVVSCGGGTSAASSAPTTVAPLTTGAARADNAGPFAVGKRTITFVDRSRSTPANGAYPAKSSRTLRTIVEYPAEGAPAAELRGSPPLAGKYPIIVFVHGFGAHADNPYLHPVAAAGFIAVAPAFPLTNAETPGGPNRSDLVNEPGDVSFVLTQFAKLPSRDADLQRAADRSSVAIMGQSVGAAVALSIGFSKQYKDSRFQAVVSSANSCLPPVCPFDGPRVPLLIMHGTADPVAPYRLALDDYARAPKPKILLTLIGAKHIQFGVPWDPIAERVTIDFFRRYLRDDVAALARLKKHGNVPGKALVKAST
jgi:predicted esterase